MTGPPWGLRALRPRFYKQVRYASTHLCQLTYGELAQELVLEHWEQDSEQQQKVIFRSILSATILGLANLSGTMNPVRLKGSIWPFHRWGIRQILPSLDAAVSLQIRWDTALIHLAIAITSAVCIMCENCHMIILCWPYLHVTIQLYTCKPTECFTFCFLIGAMCWLSCKPAVKEVHLQIWPGPMKHFRPPSIRCCHSVDKKAASN